MRGTSDLAVAERKFSGNSSRVKRGHLLYHGTLLYDFPLGLISDCLRTPPRQPHYRERRSHGEFVNNIPATAGVWSDVTNDGGDVFLNGPIAVALAALDYGVALATTTYRYGWFWCGGVCPTGLVKNAAGEKILDGDFTIDDAVTAGNGLKLADNADIACTLATKAAGDLTPAAGRCNATVTGS